ncbi:hypothetical protein B0H34DRAFT_687499 [Crassisporium funariophilum]|nr:hypothetical protein B0H34DRAFT_687499 [Crassisporium funariophilum]
MFSSGFSSNFSSGFSSSKGSESYSHSRSPQHQPRLLRNLPLYIWIPLIIVDRLLYVAKHTVCLMIPLLIGNAILKASHSGHLSINDIALTGVVGGSVLGTIRLIAKTTLAMSSQTRKAMDSINSMKDSVNFRVPGLLMFITNAAVATALSGAVGSSILLGVQRTDSDGNGFTPKLILYAAEGGALGAVTIVGGFYTVVALVLHVLKSLRERMYSTLARGPELEPLIHDGPAPPTTLKAP